MKDRLAEHAAIMASMTSHADQLETELREDYRKFGSEVRISAAMLMTELADSDGKMRIPSEIKAELCRLAVVTMMRIIVSIESEEVAA